MTLKFHYNMIALIVIYFSFWLFSLHHKPKSVSVALSPAVHSAESVLGLLLPDVVNVEFAQFDVTQKEPEATKKAKRKRIIYIKAGRDRWRFEEWFVNSTYGFAKCYRNGIFVQKLTSEGMNGNDVEICRVKFKTRLPILVTHSEPAAGHPGDTRLYLIKNRKLVVMGQFGGEYGGPIFRDYDSDGKTEWVFDDYDYYRDHQDGPKHLLVYKLLKSGKLKLWKTLPNKHRPRLPSLLGAVSW